MLDFARRSRVRAIAPVGRPSIPARDGGKLPRRDGTMMGEFKAFLLKHGVIGLAVAVVIGGAVGKLVTALVSDLIMPIVGAFTPSGNWREATVTIGSVKLG